VADRDGKRVGHPPVSALGQAGWRWDGLGHLGRRVQSDDKSALGGEVEGHSPLIWAEPITVLRFCWAKTRSIATAWGL
jgi:hypothetical protein